MCCQRIIGNLNTCFHTHTGYVSMLGQKKMFCCIIKLPDRNISKQLVACFRWCWGFKGTASVLDHASVHQIRWAHIPVSTHSCRGRSHSGLCLEISLQGKARSAAICAVHFLSSKFYYHGQTKTLSLSKNWLKVLLQCALIHFMTLKMPFQH